MNIQELIDTLERGLETLAEASPDGVAERNDMGFSGATLGPGTSLLATAGMWGLRDIIKAWGICRTHRGQVGAVPPITEAAIAELETHFPAVEKARAERILAEQEANEEMGIPVDAWGAPKLVTLKTGVEKVVRNARPTPKFWTLWRANKDAMKAAGYSVTNKNGEWVAAHWGAVNDDRRTPPALTEVLVERALPAEVAGRLLPYQIPAVVRLSALLRKYNGVLESSDLGVGKSYSSLAAALECGHRNILVVGPIATLSGWRAVAAHFHATCGYFDLTFVGWEALRGRSVTVVGDDGKKHREIQSGRPELLKFHPGLRRYSWTESVDAIIFDEIHRAKAPDSLNSKLVRAAVRQNIPAIGLSGTPATDPLELRAVGYLLRLHEDRNFYRWAGQYGAKKGRFGWEFRHKPEVAAAYLAPLHALIAERSVRIRKTDPDVAHHFPEHQVIIKGFDGNEAEIARIRDEMQEELAELDRAAKEDASRARGGKVQAVTIRLRAKQRIDLLKVPHTVAFAKDLLEQGYSVVIGVNYDDCLDALIDAFVDFRPLVIRGGQTAESRVPELARFQNNETRVALVNKKAGGAGIGLHDTRGGFPRICIDFTGDSALDDLQFLGRIPRSGGKSKCLSYIVGMWADKVDSAVLANCQQKKAQLEQLIDGCLTDADLLVRE